MKIQRKKGKHTAIGWRHMAIIFWLFEGTLDTIHQSEGKTHNINALIHKFLFYCKKQKKSKIIKFQILNFHQSNARR